MTQDDVIEMAREAGFEIDCCSLDWHKRITAFAHLVAAKEREALAQPEQEPVAIKRMKEWIEYLKRKSDFGQHMKIPSEMSAGTCWELAIELEQFINTTPPQLEERNFCPRCGKRTKDIHTCTPPQENT